MSSPMQQLVSRTHSATCSARRLIVLRMPTVVRRPAPWELGQRSGRREVMVVDNDELLDVEVWAVRFTQAIAEVVAGDRAVGQLIRWTDENVYSELSRRVRLVGLTTTADARGANGRAQVQSVHVARIGPGIAEVAAHVRHGTCSKALAMRLEIHRNRWICTALTLG